ncbi:MAG: response regulator transcription factor [Chloroflexi bacterium]|nr:response regulator transcription factor [Chloroflexota bacterium]
MSTGSRRIRVLLADDHSVTREGLRSILAGSEEFEVVGVAKNGVEAVKAASELQPDVVVMDVMMPGKDGVEACREIMESLPETRVMMLTASTEGNAVIEAVAAGAAGYLQKVADMNQVLTMIRSAAAGEGHLPTELVKRVFDRIRSGGRSREEVDLTPREKEILVSFCRGMSYVAIAEARGVKVVTVRNAIYTIQVKLGVDSKQEVVVWAVQKGLLDY